MFILQQKSSFAQVRFLGAYIRKENAPQAMAIIRHIALNLLQRCKPKRQSIKGFRKICSWDNVALTTVVTKK